MCRADSIGSESCYDSDYQSGQATDQMFRRQMDELSKYMSTQKAVDIAGIENDDLSVSRQLL